MKRKPSAAPIRIRPTSLWSALVAISTQRGRRLREAVDDQLGARRWRSWHFSVFDQADDAVLGGLDVGFLLLDEVFVFLRARRLRPRSASPRRPGRRGSPTGRRRCLPRRRGRRPGWSCRGPRRACRPGRARPRCGRRRSRRGRVRPWCRPGRPACNRRRRRSGSRSATATAGRSLRSSAARSWATARPAGPVAGRLARLVGEDDAERRGSTAAKTVSTAPTRNWMPAAAA